METRRSYSKDGISTKSSSGVPARARSTSGGRLPKGILATTLAIVVALGSPAGAQAAPGATEVWPDTPAYDPDPSVFTIQSAINDGGVVYFHPGTYDWASLGGGRIQVDNPVTLTAAPPTDLTRDPDNGALTGGSWSVKLTNPWEWNFVQVEHPTGKVIIENMEISGNKRVIGHYSGNGDLEVRYCNLKTDYPETKRVIDVWESTTGSFIVDNCVLVNGPVGQADGNADGILVWGPRPEVRITNCSVTSYGGGSSTAVEVGGLTNPHCHTTIENNILECVVSGWHYFTFAFTQTVSLTSGYAGSFNINNNKITLDHPPVGDFSWWGYGDLFCQGIQLYDLTGQGNGGIISGNQISVTNSLGINLAAWSGGAKDVIVSSNTIVGNGYFGISIAGDNNTIAKNDLSQYLAGGSAPGLGTVGSAILLEKSASDNSIIDNLIGPLIEAQVALAAVGVLGGCNNNDFIKNDYRQSEVGGLTAGNKACVYLAGAATNNLVFESGGFPPETDAKSQVLDLGTNNRVVGHDQDTLAQQEDMNPGIGQRIKDALAQMESF